MLLGETIDRLAPRDGGFYVDGTLGGAGHSTAILEAAAPTGRLLGLDRDPDALAAARKKLERFGDRALVVQSVFSRFDDVILERGFGREESGRVRVDGLLLDLGISSHQVDTADRGFSFGKSGPLDMRMSQDGMTAAEWIDVSTEEEIANALYRYAEIRTSRRLARAIKAAHDAGELKTTADLAEVCYQAASPRDRNRGAHPATRAFQAIRIAVNDELGELERALDAIPDALAIGGTAAIISFHSLEDRMVKRAFRDWSTGPSVPRGLPVRDLPEPEFELLKRAMPSDEEARENPRARSARLRAVRRVRFREEGGDV